VSYEPNRLEADINASRRRLNRGIEKFSHKLSLDRNANTSGGATASRARKVARGAARSVRDNPLPYVLIGSGVAMLLLNRNGRSRNASAPRKLAARATEAAESVRRDGRHARERVGEAASSATETAGDGARYVRRKASEARGQTGRLFDANPLAVAAIVAGVGGLIGALAPLSRPERESLRGVARQAARQGAELAERGARMVEKRVAGGGHRGSGDGAIH